MYWKPEKYSSVTKMIMELTRKETKMNEVLL
jgi:hypothetical protein